VKSKISERISDGPHCDVKFEQWLSWNKLTTYDFNSPYPMLLEKLNWKPISQMTMDKRAIIVHNYIHGRRTLPDNAIVLQNAGKLRHSHRTGHELELTIPVTRLESVLSSFLNTAKRIRNANGTCRYCSPRTIQKCRERPNSVHSPHQPEGSAESRISCVILLW
jgi:hypothetical protein